MILAVEIVASSCAHQNAFFGKPTILFQISTSKKLSGSAHGLVLKVRDTLT